MRHRLENFESQMKDYRRIIDAIIDRRDEKTRA